MAAAAELLEEHSDPFALETAARDFRASFFASPAIRDALEGLCTAATVDPVLLLGD